MPQDPRWLLARARILLALGRRHRARQLLSDFTFFSADRARANLVAARLLLRAKRTRLAARRVVEALEHGASGRAALEAVALLRRAGYRRQARAAAEMALERPPAAVGQASWQTALERALGGPLSRRAPARRRRRR